MGQTRETLPCLEDMLENELLTSEVRHGFLDRDIDSLQGPTKERDLQIESVEELE